MSNSSGSGLSVRQFAALQENLKMAFRNLRANKGRSGLVILGVALGVTTLMAMVSIIEGFKGKLESEIMSTDTTQIYVTRDDPFQDDEEVRNRPRLEIDDMEAIEESCPSVGKVLYYADFGSVARHGSDKASMMNVRGATQNYQEVMNDWVEEGRFFSPAEYATGKNVCVIGRAPADNMFGGRDPIGLKIRVDEYQEFTVVGILAETESIFGSLATNYLVIPFSTFRKHFTFDYRPVIIAFPEDDDNLGKAQEEMETLLRIRHKLTPGQKNDFNISTQDQVMDFTRQITGPLTLVGLVLASIGLMVGGIGVITIMLVSVRERTREIGIRMAVGGTRQDIMQLFLVEAATLTGLGGAVGVVTGLILGFTISLFAPVSASVPVPYVLGALLVSTTTGIFFGLYPAIQASRLDPIESLSYE
ncbi:MAG: FtsX-like permease family protein [bacterium]|nr:FtsX-like permease family protein [bacterium]